MLAIEQITNINTPLAPMDEAINRIFMASKEETVLHKARATLGDCVTNVSDEELEIYITELQHLIEYWLDNFERRLFEGLTLKQALGEVV